MSKVAFGKSTSTSSLTKLTTPLGRRSSANVSPLRSSNTSSRTNLLKTTSKPDPFDSKASTTDKSPASVDASPWTTIQKQGSNLISDSFLCGNLRSGNNSPDASSPNQISDNLAYLQLKAALTKNDKSGTFDETTFLRKELHIRAQTIDQLKKENITLRKEIEEFISIADKIHKNLDQELRQYEARIATLERENSDLLAENKFYKAQAQTRLKQKIVSPSLQSPFELDTPAIETPNAEKSQRDMEGFYSKINDKLMNFLSETKNQLESFHRNVKTEAHEIKEKHQTPTSQELQQPDNHATQSTQASRPVSRANSIQQDPRKANQSPSLLKKNVKNEISSSRNVTPLTSRNITPTSSKNITPKSTLKSGLGNSHKESLSGKLTAGGVLTERRQKSIALK